jgi:hypothetical protein
MVVRIDVILAEIVTAQCNEELYLLVCNRSVFFVLVFYSVGGH